MVDERRALASEPFVSRQRKIGRQLPGPELSFLVRQYEEDVVRARMLVHGIPCSYGSSASAGILPSVAAGRKKVVGLWTYRRAPP